jgi:purine-nucleoside phosphorylase
MSGLALERLLQSVLIQTVVINTLIEIGSCGLLRVKINEPQTGFCIGLIF